MGPFLLNIRTAALEQAAFGMPEPERLPRARCPETHESRPAFDGVIPLVGSIADDF
jgi:hypothetical protein